jgi:hypothetical protein
LHWTVEVEHVLETPSHPPPQAENSLFGGKMPVRSSTGQPMGFAAPAPISIRESARDRHENRHRQKYSSGASYFR